MDGGYPEQNGFGHEEWNFQIEDAFEGRVFGYMYYKPSAKTLFQAGGSFDIAFWARHPSTRKVLLVGRYEEAIPATPEDCARLELHWSRSGVFDRRANELTAAVPSISLERAREEVVAAARQRELFWCRTDKVDVLGTPVDVSNRVRSYRFTTPTVIEDPWSALVQSDDQPPSPEPRMTAPLAEDAYQREVGARQQLILQRHRKLSNQLTEWLREQGFEDVRQEQNAVDLEFCAGSSLSRVEIKICFSTSTTLAIREAIGQLIEYNYYGNRKPAHRWAIVLDREPSIADKLYIRRLNEVFSLPLNLGWKSGEGFEFLVQLR